MRGVGGNGDGEGRLGRACEWKLRVARTKGEGIRGEHRRGEERRRDYR